jgi:translation elongation factor P/translation initiation factor 5A
MPVEAISKHDAQFLDNLEKDVQPLNISKSYEELRLDKDNIEEKINNLSSTNWSIVIRNSADNHYE